MAFILLLLLITIPVPSRHVMRRWWWYKSTYALIDSNLHASQPAHSVHREVTFLQTTLSTSLPLYAFACIYKPTPNYPATPLLFLHCSGTIFSFRFMIANGIRIAAEN